MGGRRLEPRYLGRVPGIGRARRCHPDRVFDLDADDLVDTDARRSFRSHANYLHAFAMVIRGGMFVTSTVALSRVTRAVADFPAPNGSRRHDQETLHGCLVRAWGAELLLATGRRIATDDELLRLINSWGVVQAYYVAYSATQALIVAEGRARPPAHPTTQRQAVDLWVTRRGAVAPWSFAVASPTHRLAGADGAINGPGRPIREVHPWTGCDPQSCWDIAALALRTTRDHAVDEALANERDRKLSARRRAWRDEEEARHAAGRQPRKQPAWPATARLAAEESQAVRDKVRPYTTLDYLYRLRVKANYEDATVFTEGPEDEDSSDTVARDLELVASATLLAHELRVGQLIGGDTMMNMVDAWLASNAQQHNVALAARRNLLDQHLRPQHG